MKVKEKLNKALRTSRAVRYRAYKKVGVERHRQKIDITLVLMMLTCVISLPLFLYWSKSPSPVASEVVCAEVEDDEVVHEDLGDEPVVLEQQASLHELEKRAQLGEVESILRTLQKGDSLLGILSQEKVSATDRVAIADALELLIDLRALRPGNTFILFMENEEIVGLSLTMRENETVAVLKESSGAWTPFFHAGRVESKSERLMGEIERTFSGSAKKAGVPDNIINQVTDALDGEVDFTADLKAGDTFDIVVESKVTQGGLEIGAKQLLFVGLKTGNKEIARYSYTDRSGMPGFYSARGATSAKVIMKRPMKARPRLSSPYGTRRHPTLLYEIFHKGVDLAAPMNTPVVAAADGTIEQIGRKGSYGKYIRLKHAGGYQTAYAHLNGYRRDLKAGSKVKRGEVIAYVGSTGRSTGPHLHFEVIKNNKTVNPFGQNAIPSRQLKDLELERFQAFAEGVHPDFRRHLAGKIPPPPQPKPF